MVYITQKMLRVLENKMDKGWFTLGDVKEIVGGTGKEHFQVLLDMYVQGLVDLMDTDKSEQLIKREEYLRSGSLLESQAQILGSTREYIPY